MEWVLLCVGKTADQAGEQQILDYQKRISRYFNFQIITLPAVKSNKNWPVPIQQTKEEEKLLSQLRPQDRVVLLDEKGSHYTSVDFAQKLDKMQHQGSKRIVFIVGGPFGFSTAFKKQFSEHLALSKMTFSHQMIRLFFCEQLYRACTILNHHPYHNI